MRFIDEATIKVSAGKGGDGCASFRREKFIPKGGPDGGDGGRGGSVILEASKDIQTLIDFRYQPHYQAQAGEKGHGAQCYGKGAEDIIIKVPMGTLVRSEDGSIDVDLIEDKQQILVAKGGKGGLGNIHFKSSTNQAPRTFTKGELGEEHTLQLELKLLSQVGLVGFPNAGKSTLLRALSSARPKVGDYPFTTLVPHLGILETDPPITLADIPGIIENAHQGAGLGIQFLKHISRSACLLFVLSFDRERDLDRTYGALIQELKAYDLELLNRPRIVVLNKADLLIDAGSEESSQFSDEQRQIFAAEFEKFKRVHPECHLISAKHHEGLESLIRHIQTVVHQPLKLEMAVVS